MYWFTVQELHWICAWCGPRLQVYRSLVDDMGAPSWTLMRGGHAAVAEGDDDVVRVLLDSDWETVCGHFSRLIQDDAMQESEEEDMEESASNK